MSTQVFPSLSGLEFPTKRSESWDGVTVQESVSGKRTSINNWSYPRYQWELTASVLPTSSALTNAPASADFQTLFGFFNSRGGRFDTFLYTDADDNSVTAQALGVGDGVTLTYQLVSAFGGFVQPILAPNVVSNVYLNAVSQSSSLWSVTAWGSTAPGILAFVTAPTSTQAVTATFSYYFPCRFADQTMSYSKFMSNLYENRSIKFESEK